MDVAADPALAPAHAMAPGPQPEALGKKPPVRVLVFSSLYPSSTRPSHGIFVETRLRELLKTGEVQARVLAPVPWFFSTNPRYGEKAQMAATPHEETRHGLLVRHPRFLVIPKLGMTVAPLLLALASIGPIKRLQREGFDFDLIDAHYYYPDGVAAAALARALGKPFIVTARGTDLNLIPEYSGPRRRILATAAQAAASVGVCRALMVRLAELGADPAKLHVLRNGVDLERFQPLPRAAARLRLGLPEDGRILLSVGHLIERKGHHVAIEALRSLPQDVMLVLAGAGEERARLEGLSRACGVESRVRFAGAVPQADLKWHYSAADALTLCSSREGWANVLLESMACGTPVIATDIWGTPEVVAAPVAGRLMRERSAAALAESFTALFADYPAREATRRYAEGFSWQATTEGQLRLMRAVVGLEPAPPNLVPVAQ